MRPVKTKHSGKPSNTKQSTGEVVPPRAERFFSSKPVVVEVSGGCVVEVHNLPEPLVWVLLDWDNLLGDMYIPGTTELEWDKFDAAMKAWIKAKYPDEHKQVQRRITQDRKRAGGGQ